MRSAELADDHKGNDQTVKADTFCKTDVNQGLTDETGNLKREFCKDGIHMYADAYDVVYRNLEKYL